GLQFSMSSPRSISPMTYSGSSGIETPSIGSNSSRSVISTTTKPGLSSRASNGASADGGMREGCTTSSPCWVAAESDWPIDTKSSFEYPVRAGTPSCTSRRSCVGTSNATGLSCFIVVPFENTLGRTRITSTCVILFRGSRKPTRRLQKCRRGALRVDDSSALAGMSLGLLDALGYPQKGRHTQRLFRCMVYRIKHNFTYKIPALKYVKNIAFKGLSK